MQLNNNEWMTFKCQIPRSTKKYSKEENTLSDETNRFIISTKRIWQLSLLFWNPIHLLEDSCALFIVEISFFNQNVFHFWQWCYLRFFFLFWDLAPLLKQQLLIPLWIIFKAKRITALTDYHLLFVLYDFRRIVKNYVV